MAPEVSINIDFSINLAYVFIDNAWLPWSFKNILENMKKILLNILSYLLVYHTLYTKCINVYLAGRETMKIFIFHRLLREESKT